ncbi:hypothetical protein NQ315_004544 [Exocentrus adspersus]|uniref:SWIM-type domain-containing protein n=1 Tax=Exocentrus adspersus TaxID=1586481 RepID=A0AAV8V7X7_9CUCU|nr:hypothetical protein NQ315_004544 [Exocentrus adspersus]
MFGHTSRQKTSLVISTVLLTLSHDFVPRFLGYGHMNRPEFVENHVTAFANQLYNTDPENQKAIVYIDATYFEVQKSKNFKVLRKSFSNHKKYHLLKTVMDLASDGYILSTHGPYFCDSANNDANILLKEYQNDIGNIREVELPAHLGARNQPSTEDANHSRIITKIRWIIELRNGHVKSTSKFLRDCIPNTHIRHLKDIFKVVCAMLNKYHEPITMEDATVELANEMRRKALEENHVQTYVEQNNLIRRRGIWHNLIGHQIEFPRLELEILKSLTFGVFQLRLSPLYIQDNMDQDGRHCIEIDTRLGENGLIKVRLFSRHRNNTKYQLFVAFDMNANEITGHYCTCRSGARVVGMCCHVASTIWYLSYSRHIMENITFPSTNPLECVQDAAVREIAEEENELPEIV